MSFARRLLAGGSLVTAVAAAFAIFLMVNWLSFRHWSRFDWTQSKVYSISPTTEKVLARLDRPLRIVVFLPAEGTQRSPVYDEVRELVDRYAAASRFVRVEYVDPFRNRIRGQEVARQYGLQRASTIVFEYGEGADARRHFVDEGKLADYDWSHLAFGERPRLRAFKGEEIFTSAIRGLAERKLRVVFTAGHGEPSFKGAAEQDYGQAAEALRRANFEVEEWTGLAGDRVPEGTDLLVVGGPRQPFLPNEIEAIRRYLAEGGRAMFLFEPIFAADRKGLLKTGLEAIAAEWGVSVDDAIVIDPDSALPVFGPDTLFTNRYRPHPSTVGLEAFPIILALARPISRGGEPPVGYEADILLETSRQGWGETDLDALPAVRRDETDLPGPVPLAVAVSSKATNLSEEMEKSVPGMRKVEPEPALAGGKTRLIVYGDGELPSNLLFERNQGPFLAGISWLAAREDSLGIAPKKTGKVALRLNRDQLFRVDLILFLLLPGIAIGVGLAVGWFRRN
jgi:ABC-type uncharacterized transport system involved in gliding motility auxiliary subunit